MRELGLIGVLGLLFGLGAYRGTGELGVFGAVNLAVGAVALIAATVLFVRFRLRQGGGSPMGPLVDAALGFVAVAWGAILVQQAAAVSDVRFDWTEEGRYELAEATARTVAELPERVYATLYYDPYDPRRRRTRLLLDQLSRHGDVVVRQRQLGVAPEEEDFFAIGSSNTVVFELGDTWERVDRPTEGAVFEALSFLASTRAAPRVVYVTTGAGEGDVTKTGDTGFSGLAAALETEGIQLRQIASSALSEIPTDADAVLMISPQRNLHPATLDAVRRYLEAGGNLLAMLQPGVRSGIEELLAEFGMESPDQLVIDPASADLDGARRGTDPIAFNYASDNGVTRGLDRNRRTYFRGARSFRLRKPRPDDELRAVVFASGDSWLHPDVGVLERGVAPDQPNGARTDYHPLVVTGRFPRGEATAQIVAFGDSDFANNANLRSLYNLDLFMNAAHWLLRDETRITLRPKASAVIQFPVPIQNSLKAFYGVGLLVPQALLLVGGLVWLRRRAA